MVDSKIDHAAMLEKKMKLNILDSSL